MIHRQPAALTFVIHGFSIPSVISYRDTAFSRNILEAMQGFNMRKGALRGPCSRISTVSRIGEGELRVSAVARTSRAERVEWTGA